MKIQIVFISNDAQTHTDVTVAVTTQNWTNSLDPKAKNTVGIFLSAV